jgi:chaperonin GroES
LVNPFKPLADRVVLQPKAREDTSRGGIVLPDTVKEKPQEGVVVAVGPGRMLDNGTRIPMEVKEGDTVVYAKYAGTELKHEDVEYIIMRESDLMAVKP